MAAHVLMVLATLGRGGAETVVIDWIRRFDPSLVQVDIVVNEGDTYAYEEEAVALGCRVIRAPIFRGWNTLSYAKWWWSCLARHPEWDIIHAHHTVPAFIYLGLAGLQGRTTIAHSHHAGRDGGALGIMRALLSLPLRVVAHYRMACSTEAGEWMFGKRSPVLLVRNGINCRGFQFDAKQRSAVRAELELEGAFVIGNVARFSPAKNHIRLLRIFAAVLESIPSARLVLVGDGARRREIEHEVSSLGITNQVILLGERSDIGRLLSAMDMILLPSHYEGLPVSILEAQASGLPCVVSAAVSREVEVTDLVRFLSLDEPDAVWAMAIREAVRGREDRIALGAGVSLAGFDADQSAADVQGIYLRMGCPSDPTQNMKEQF